MEAGGRLYSLVSRGKGFEIYSNLISKPENCCLVDKLCLTLQPHRL